MIAPTQMSTQGLKFNFRYHAPNSERPELRTSPNSERPISKSHGLIINFFAKMIFVDLRSDNDVLFNLKKEWSRIHYNYPFKENNMRKFLFLLLYGCSYSLTIQIVYNYEYPIPKQYTPKPKPEYNFEEKIEIKDNQIRGLVMKPPQIVIFIQQGNNLLNRYSEKRRISMYQ